MGEGRAPRRLVIDGERTLGVLDLAGDGYVFRAYEPGLQRLDGHRFRSPEVGIALLKTFAGAPAARPAPVFDLGLTGFSQRSETTQRSETAQGSETAQRADAQPAYAGGAAPDTPEPA